MDDWDQPSTTFGASAAPAPTDVDTLRRELAKALERLETMERRLKKLEAAAAGSQTRTSGA